jgi:hypothetical protein
MGLENLVRQLEERFCTIGKRLVPRPIRDWWTDEAGRLATALDQHRERARQFHQAAQETRSRLAENEVREAILASQVETYIHSGEQARAYQLALELDRVRTQMTEDRAGLPREEKAWRTHRERIAELERHLDEVRSHLSPWANA